VELQVLAPSATPILPLAPLLMDEAATRPLSASPSPALAQVDTQYGY